MLRPSISQSGIPLPSDNIQRSLYQTLSDLTTMADACRQRLTVFKKKWHSDEDCFPAAHLLKLTYRRSAITKSYELLTLVFILFESGCCRISLQASFLTRLLSFLFHLYGDITYS
jgi:hypothetical protein